jgi:hypothetical protein
VPIPFASAYWGAGSGTQSESSFFVGYQIDNIAAVFDPGYVNSFAEIHPQNSWPAQAAKTIFKILRKGIDYTVGASRIYLVVAASPLTGSSFLNNYDYTLALIPVV